MANPPRPKASRVAISRRRAHIRRRRAEKRSRTTSQGGLSPLVYLYDDATLGTCIVSAQLHGDESDQSSSIRARYQATSIETAEQ